MAASAARPRRADARRCRRAGKPEGSPRRDRRTAPCDLSAAGGRRRAVARRPDLIFHLAAIVSGEAEADFDKGYRINLDGTRHLFEAIRGRGDGYKPRAGLHLVDRRLRRAVPGAIGDEFLTAPLTSYGTQKAIGELLLADYSRRGFFDGIGIRLPTICIRPGAPNKAASGFFSNILREPLVGKEAVLPVRRHVRHWHASPRAAVGFLLHAATIDLDRARRPAQPDHAGAVGDGRRADRGACAASPAMRPFAASAASPIPLIERIVAGWPRSFAAGRAQALGFRAETSFDDIVRIHIEDELGGRLP